METTTLPSYKIQKDKIIDAYFKDEIKPMNANFCFCGTLCNNTSVWYSSKGHNGYTSKEYLRMEEGLFKILYPSDWGDEKSKNWDGDEDQLFDAMCEALEILKKIHIEHGEVIEEDLPLTKRQLQTL